MADIAGIDPLAQALENERLPKRIRAPKTYA